MLATSIWKGRVGVGHRRRDPFGDHGEERLEVVRFLVEFALGIALLGAGVDDREVELFFVGVEFAEEVEDLVQGICRAGAGAVDLVDDHDRLDSQVEGFLEHEAGLRHRSVEGIDQQQDRVDHLQHPLDFAAEVGMAGGVDDVDLQPAVVNGKVLGEDGDAALLLQVVAVHDPFGDDLVLAEDSGLLEHGVDQGGLAVVDVGDDGDVADVLGHDLNGSLPALPGVGGFCKTHLI